MLKSKRVYSQPGFALVEVVVAFFITTMSLGVIFQIYAKGVTSGVLANEYASALSIAESRLAEISSDSEMRNLENQGTEEDRYDWEIRTTDYMIANRADRTRTSYSLVWVDVTVSWLSQGKTHEIELQTLKPIILE